MQEFIPNTLSLEFAYHHGRPKMTARLNHGAQKGRYLRFLIDSGADYTLISKSSALTLGIEYKKLKDQEIEIEIANLTHIHAKKTNVDIAIGEHKFTIPVLIAKEEVEDLLGREGVFTRFDITFQEKQGRVIFKRVKC